VIAIAALSGPLPKLGVVAVAAFTAIVLVHPGDRVRAVSMLTALVLAPILLLAAIWHSPQLAVIHHHPLRAIVVGVVALGAVGLLALAIQRRPWLLAVLVVFTLPFRIPISAGGTTSNLLVPLYVVVGAGALAFIFGALPAGRFRGRQAHDGVVEDQPPPGWIERLLALFVVLYALQAIYSPSFEKALQQVVFFYVPFALVFFLLRRLRWTSELLRRCLVVVVSLALLFCVIGFVEYATKTLLLNPKLVAENDLHTYFAINAVFFDPDIFGRFLALVMITVATVLVYTRRDRVQLLSVGVLAVLWAGLVLTLSRSSLGALLVGLGVIGAMRWKARPVLFAAVAVVVLGIAAVAISPRTFGLNQGLNGASSGRAGLVSGGLRLFGQRPGWGYGSASFEREYLCRIKHQCQPPSATSQTLSASHTIAVTVAAEQGILGEIPYLALVIVSIVVLVRGARFDPARAAVAAAFVALVFHTELYADFLEDPVTWTLLAIGTAMAYAARPRTPPRTARPSEVPAVA
jgi:putative inorganic carbon (HCO3(-)) transporter